MKKALPAIAVSAAGLTWLLHAQGVIDNTPAAAHGSTDAAPGASSGASAGGSAAGGSPGAAAGPAPTTTRPPFVGGDDEDGPVRPSQPSQRQTPTTTAPSNNNGGNRTLDGPVVDTRYGPVQVQVVMNGSKIVDVKVPEYPTHARRSQDINDQALPMLRDEVLSAQSAQIDGVSGATYTTEAYQESLQAALDKAH